MHLQRFLFINILHWISETTDWIMKILFLNEKNFVTLMYHRPYVYSDIISYWIKLKNIGTFYVLGKFEILSKVSFVLTSWSCCKISKLLDLCILNFMLKIVHTFRTSKKAGGRKNIRIFLHEFRIWFKNYKKLRNHKIAFYISLIIYVHSMEWI